MKKQLEGLAHFALGIVFTLAFLYIFDFNWERRFVLYHIRNELKKEMPRNEVEDVIARHQTSFIRKHETEDGIVLRVEVGIARSYFLQIGFAEDKLNFAKFATENGPHPPKDAPPNLDCSIKENGILE